MPPDSVVVVSAAVPIVVMRMCTTDGGPEALAPRALKTTTDSRNILLVSFYLHALRPRHDAAAIAFVISLVVMSACRSRPRWLMALADCDAAEMLGAFDAGIE
jgi:hypothetical protein